MDVNHTRRVTYRMTTKNFPRHITTPPVLVESERFLAKFAENQDEVRKALRLRYEVFNSEQGKGLKDSIGQGIDSDEFDEQCLHLIVLEKKSGRAVGTYRAHLGSRAKLKKRGFYSSRFFRIKGLDKIADKCIELGRSCVSPEFRTGAVVGILWKAIALLLLRSDRTYMVGCVSLETTDSKIGRALYRHLSQTRVVSQEITAVPRTQFLLDGAPEHEIEKVLGDKTALKKYIPPLFKGYLRLGGLICGEPAFDREFGTIDFFIIVDVREVPDRYRRHFDYVKNSG